MAGAAPSSASPKGAPTFTRGDTAYLRKASGEFGQVPKGEAAAAIASDEGWLPATAEEVEKHDRDKENSSTGNKLRAFGESVGSGLVDLAQAPLAAPVALGSAALGVKNPLEGTGGRDTLENLATLWGDFKEPSTGKTGEAYGREYGEKAREVAEANPGEVTAGQFAAAALGGAALGGGASAIGTGLASKLGGGLAARAAGALARGAVEGSAYGYAGASEEAYRHNEPLSGEKLVASMGLAAILGGTVSLGAEGLGGVLRRGLGLGGSEAAAGAAEAATSRLGAGAEAEGGTVSRALREFADDRTGSAIGVKSGMAKKLGRTAEQFETESKELAQAVRGMKLEDGSDVFQAVQTKGGLSERIATKVEQLDQKLESFQTKAGELASAHPEIAPKPVEVAARIRSEISDRLAAHPDTAMAGMAQPIEQLATDLETIGARKGGSPMAELGEIRSGLDERIAQLKAGVQQGPPVRLADLEKARGIIDGEISATTDKATQFLDEGAAGAYKRAKNERRLLELAQGIAENSGGSLLDSVSDYGAAAIGALSHGGIGGLATGLANKVIREHASSAMAVLADRLANTLDGKIEQGLGSFFRESAKRAEAGAAGAKALAAAVPIRRAATPLAVDAFVGRSKDLPTAYAKRVEQLVNATASGGAGAQARVAAAMGPGFEATPQLTQAATVAAQRGAQYLMSQIPGGSKAPTVFEPSRTLPPSELEMQIFAQKYQAVSNPLSVIDDLRRGTVTHAQIDAIKTVYPELYQQIQTKTMEGITKLDQQGKRMPFDDRLILDLFLDLNGAGEPTLSGEFSDRLSGMLSAQQKQQAKPAPPSRAPMKSLSSAATPASQSVLEGG